MMVKIPGLIVPPFTLVHTGDNVIGNAIPTVTRKTLQNITYDESYIGSVTTLPIYTPVPLPLTMEITNRDSNPVLHASYNGSQLETLTTGPFRLDMTFGLPGGQLYGRRMDLSPGITANPNTSRALVSYVAGSLSKHINDSTLALKTGYPNDRRNMFLTYNNGSREYIRDMNFFLSTVRGLEAYPVSNDSAYWSMNGVAISRRHILSVYHTGSQVGQLLYFLTRTGNQIITRTVISAQRLNPACDQTVALLDSQLPVDFDFAQILTNTYSKLPEYALINNTTPTTEISDPTLRLVPICVFNHDIRPGINYISFVTTGTNAALIMSPSLINEEPLADEWQQKVRGGDSGSPGFVIINNRLVVLAVWTSIMGGFCTGELITDLQASMDALCDNAGFAHEALSIADTSMFTTY